MDDIKFVINFDFPQQSEDYIHRIGRTGRASKTGTAITFFNPKEDARHAGELVNVLAEAKQEVPSRLQQMAQSRSRYSGMFLQYNYGSLVVFQYSTFETYLHVDQYSITHSTLILMLVCLAAHVLGFSL